MNSRYTCFSDRREETNSEQSLPVRNLNRLHFAFTSYVQATITIYDFAHIGAHGQT